MSDIVSVLNKESSKLSVNNDISFKIDVNNSINTLPYGDINKILNVSEQFYKERNASTNYRFIFSINQNMSNVLTDITFDPTQGSTLKDGLMMFERTLFTEDGEGNQLFTTIDESIDNYLVNKNGWLGYYVPKWYNSSVYPNFAYIGNDKINSFIELKPKITELEMTPPSQTRNWEFILTYPKTGDTEHFIVKDGLLITNTGSASVGTKTLTLVTTPVKHNLSAGDSVKINNKKYTVIRVGNDNGDNKEYSYVINVTYPSIEVSPGDRMIKLYNGNESTYYLRIFTGLTEVYDYELYPLAFSKNIFNDRVSQCVFNKDIDISNYSDNLGRPLSEVYLTIVRNSTSGFTTNSCGLDIQSLDSDKNYPELSNIRKIHKLTSPWPVTDDKIGSEVFASNTGFYGDIVEYNTYTVQEVVLCDIMHRFNRTDRDANDRPEGYYYKPHYKIPLRYWSTFIEQGDDSVYDVPYYAQDIGDGRYLWRDLLDIGNNDGQEDLLDYPFLNGSHYRYSNINFNLRRQDPYNNFNLYYGESPRDVYGGKTDMSNLNIKKGDDGNGCC